MNQPAIKDPLLNELERLPKELRRQVRELVHALAATSSDPIHGLRFAAAEGGEAAGDGPLLTPDAEPDPTVKRILSLISGGQILTARRLAAEAAARFPDHARIQTAERMLNGDGNPSLSPRGPEPSTEEEFAWLRSPPEWARGKWVALIGRKVVAMADTLVELTDSLKSMDLPKRPLVHRIA